MKLLTVQATIQAPIEKVWQLWTTPVHVMGWNFASPDWHCPQAKNDLELGGEFHYLMAARDGSFEFDFWGTFQNIVQGQLLEIKLGDGRMMTVRFETSEDATLVTEIFEPENQNPEEMQQMGWQMILDNFKHYVESTSSL